LAQHKDSDLSTDRIGPLSVTQAGFAVLSTRSGGGLCLSVSSLSDVAQRQPASRLLPSRISQFLRAEIRTLTSEVEVQPSAHPKRSDTVPTPPCFIRSVTPGLGPRIAQHVLCALARPYPGIQRF
jgi:hypothetical protein